MQGVYGLQQGSDDSWPEQLAFFILFLTFEESFYLSLASIALLLM